METSEPETASGMTTLTPEVLLNILAQQARQQHEASVAQTNAISLLAENVHTTLPTSKPSLLKDPPTYSGDREELESFLGHVALAFRTNPTRFSSHEAKCLYLAGLLRGPAFNWFSPVLKEDNPELLRDIDKFVSDLRTVFGDPRSSEHLQDQLLYLRQTTSVSLFFTEFVRLRVRVDLEEPFAIVLFRNGLKPVIQDELATILTPFTTVREMAEVAIRIDNRLQERRRARGFDNRSDRARPPFRTSPPAHYRHPAPVSAPVGEVPMEIDSVKRLPPLTERERERRRHEGLCLYCGKSGHVVRQCPESKYYVNPSPKNE